MATTTASVPLEDALHNPVSSTAAPEAKALAPSHKETAETLASSIASEEANVDGLTMATIDASASTAVEEDDQVQQQDCDEYLQQVEEYIAKEQLFSAARLIEEKIPESLWTEAHRGLLETVADCQEAVADLIDMDPSHAGWTKQKGGTDYTTIYYKMGDNDSLTCRIETHMEQDLLVPLLAVLNEVQLYDSWIPSWRLPRIGVESAQVLHRYGRANQIIQVVGNVPWPFAKRDVVMQAIAIDAIEEDHYISVRMKNLPTGRFVPSPEEGVERVDFLGAFLFRACADNPNLLLVSFKMFVDPHMGGIPHNLVNFITRTVIGSIWDMLLHVAEGVKDGNRPQHQQAIQEKQEFYHWVEERVQVLLKKLNTDT